MQFSWRPRVGSLLSDAEEADIVSKLKVYSKRYKFWTCISLLFGRVNPLLSFNVTSHINVLGHIGVQYCYRWFHLQLPAHSARNVM